MGQEKLPHSFDSWSKQETKYDEDCLRTSFAGFEFSILESKWVLDSETTINVTFVQNFPPEYRKAILETLTYFAEYRSAKYTSSMSFLLRKYIKGSTSLCLNGLLSFKVGCPERSKNDYLSRLRCFFRQAEYLGFDAPREFMKEINSWVLAGSEKGIPVLTQDPETGPFSELEFRAIKSNLDHKYAEGVISDREYSLAQLFAATFRRPINLKQLKVKDLITSSKALITKQPIYQLNIPRAKGKRRKFRSQFKAFALVQSIGQVICQHIETATKELEKKIGRELLLEEVKELPMFFNEQVAEELKSLKGSQVMAYLSSELPHMKRSDLTFELRTIIERLRIISERTGQPLKVSGYRFRYSGGTRAAEAGAGLVTIAELLDHTDTQHAGVYIANSSELGEQISKIMNNPLARYASAFLGKVVTNEQEACKENPNASRIPCRDKECDVGSCGSSSFCTDYAPVACYLCPKFRPWRDAPHHLVLSWLIEERERLSNTLDDAKVAAINDSAILAVAQVIKICEEEKDNG
ncbi:MAG TPA: site-specific integrase [Pseudoalteromonas sp.]|nr:site-specific integrase [Pseudoalteromonas sp.]|tara:strand:- start:16486 stop:18057 length:1572 start_codon:yes stop_codon:yes gene_type:complete